ncbi:MAG TPA: carboxypeptidase-like regulatory domain-containing protein [Blastocatellia bacterium]|jgi:hypothetical protein
MMKRFVPASLLLSLIVAGHAIAQTSSKSAATSRAITGRVLDHNGRPAADKRLHLQKVKGGPRFSFSAYTGEAGEFRFENLSSGIYRIMTTGLTDEDRTRIYRPGESVTLRLRKGGVITGTVSDSTGEPMIAVRVQVTRVRDEQGRRVRGSIIASSAQQSARVTDDRGMYRFWGLSPGLYIICAVGQDTYQRHPVLSEMEKSSPTYHPSAKTAEAAVEVRVQDGQEATGIDINHRDEIGHTISGNVSGQLEVDDGRQERGVGVMLFQAATGTLLQVKPLQPDDKSAGFAFESLADGEYDLIALREAAQSIEAASPERRVLVKGKSVTGVELRLAPLGSIEGRLALETTPRPVCQPKRVVRLNEASIILHAEKAGPRRLSLDPTSSELGDGLGVSDEKGAFTISPVIAGRYFVEAQLPGTDWYISSIALSGPARSGPADLAREGVTIKPGERVAGLTISIREDAASARGSILFPKERTNLPPGLRVYLVPAEPDQKDNALRFFEAAVKDDNTFQFLNIAPGRYWIIARQIDGASEEQVRPLAWDREARIKLLREARAAKNSIELKPCQNLSDRGLPYTGEPARLEQEK